jgi:glycosyltransferase involved in cell wall biosynthesis
LNNQDAKILIVSYYWPPAGGPGVQRWLKFVKYLPDFGIQPVVYIPENPTYPIIDKKLQQEVSKDVIILKNKIFEPYQLARIFSKKDATKISSGIIPNKKKQSFVQKLMLWIRGNIFIPDARKFWVNPSVKYLEKYIEENNITTLITTGPPHSLHLIGLAIKKKKNIQWIADFRDPWTTIGYHKELKLSSFAEKKHKSLEKKVLNTADKIIVTSPTTQKEFQALTSQPIAVITNGYDVEPVTRKPLDEKFTLAHIGSLLSERNPEILWQTLAELAQEIPDFQNHFELKLIGAVSQEVLNTLEKYSLSKFCNNIGYVPHNEAVEAQRSSQVLLLIEINSPETRCIIPGKLFEYMVSERPIVALGPDGSDIAPILKETNTGSFFLYTEKDKLKSRILEYYELYLQNNLKVHAVGLQKYSRKNLTQQLVSFIKN